HKSTHGKPGPVRAVAECQSIATGRVTRVGTCWERRVRSVTCSLLLAAEVVSPLDHGAQDLLRRLIARTDSAEAAERHPQTRPARGGTQPMWASGAASIVRFPDIKRQLTCRLDVLSIERNRDGEEDCFCQRPFWRCD